MGKAETLLARRIVYAINARGHWVWKNHGSIFSRRGLSDISGIHKEGLGIIIEVKIENGKHPLTEQQYEFLCEARRRSKNAIIGVATSVEYAIAIVDGSITQDWSYWKGMTVAHRIAKRKRNVSALLENELPKGRLTEPEEGI